MGSFDGVAETYGKHRHSYPAELRDHLVQIGALKPESNVVDLGAGTGQLAVMAADVTANVVAIEPEPDMLRVGQQTTASLPSIRWLLGADRDLLQLADLPVDLVLIGNAFHHMDQVQLLADLDSAVEASGTVVVCSTSIPVWLQDVAWSVTLRQQLTEELGRPPSKTGVPDHESDAVVLGSSAFSHIDRWTFEREQQRTAESIVGEIVSAASGAIDTKAEQRLLSALEPHLTNGKLAETVKTTALIARRPTSPDNTRP